VPALLAQAVEAEVAALLSCHADKLTADGRQRLVRHGHLPEREIMTGIGPIAVRCPGCAIVSAKALGAFAFPRRFCRPILVDRRASM